MRILTFYFILLGFQSLGQTTDSNTVFIHNTLIYSCDALFPDYTLQVKIPENWGWKEARLIVWNRWGEILHDSSAIPPEWDANEYSNREGMYKYRLTGTFTNGQTVDVSDWVYVLL